MTENENVNFKYDEVKKETEKAFLLKMGNADIWFPKSMVTVSKEESIVGIPDWLATIKVEKENLPKTYQISD